jgi:hypothetical protein
MFSSLLKTTIAAGLFFSLLATGARGQQQTAELTGRVSDPSGAAIPGATVTVMNRDRGIQRVVTSDPQGEYVVPLLPPATGYEVKVSKAGFKNVTQSGITLQVAQVARVDFALEVGTVTQTVSVKGTAPLLDTETSSIGQVVASRTITNLPLNGRSSFRLVALTPGVTMSSAAYGQFGDVPVNTVFDTNFSINGGRFESNEILIDGVPSTTGYFDQITTIPSVDDTEEFKVQSDNLSAQYGRFSGGVINVATRAGTNQLHGDAFEFLRNSSLDANDFFDNRARTPVTPLKMNQFGFAVGGPVVLPKVYHGRNKTFFFADYQGTRRIQGSTFLGSVPTIAQRAGDFSQTFNSSGQLVTIYNPFSTVPNPSSAGQYIRTQFSGNMIPTSMVDPVAAKMIDYYPAPNLPGAPFTGADNFISNAPLLVDQDEGSARIDQNVTDRYRLFGRFAMSVTPLTQPNYFGNIASPCPGQVGTTYFRNYTFTFGNTVAFSPTLLLSANYGFARWFQLRTMLSYGFNNESLGFPSSLVDQIQVPVFPAVSVAGYTGLANQSYLSNGNDTHSLVVYLTKIAGRHTLTMGTDLRMYRINFLNVSNGAGTYCFALAQSRGPNPNVTTTTSGNGIASFLLGAGNSGSIPIGAGAEMQDFYLAGYLEDTVRATRKLTLNLGLRYETETPVTDRHNKLNYFSLTLPSPARNSQFPTLTGGLAFAATGGNPRTVYSQNEDNFGPRFGVAYSPTHNTVIRGGFGVFYAPLELANNAVGSLANEGFSSSTTWVTSLNGGLTPFNLLNNPFPGGLIAPTGSSLGAATELGQAITVWDSNPKTPETLQWNLDVQRQLPSNILIDLAYVGTRGLYLTSDQELDTLNPTYLSLGTGLQSLVANPFASLITSGTLAQPTVAQQQLLLPYPQFTSVDEVNSTWGNSIYHSMQLKLDKHTTHGVDFLAAYTIAKLISNVRAQEAPTGSVAATNVQNWYDLAAERSLSEYDVPQALVLSSVAQLPFGQGMRFFTDTGGLVSRLISGWRATGVLTEESGYPLALTVPVTGGGDRPNGTNINANLPSSRPIGQKVLEWFNTKAFTIPAPFTFGNVSRTLPNVRGPGMNNLDFSLIKETQISERFGLEFRAEAFNLLNTPHFGLPNTDLADPTFGQLTSTILSPREIQFGLKLSF